MIRCQKCKHAQPNHDKQFVSCLLHNYIVQPNHTCARAKERPLKLLLGKLPEYYREREIK